MNFRRKFELSLILLVGLVVSSIALFVNIGYDRSKAELLFESESRHLAAKIQQNLDIDLTVLDSVAAFFRASEFVSRSEFAVFTKSIINNNQMLQAIEWIPKITESEIEQYTQNARSDGVESFTIFEKNSDHQAVEVSSREEYFPVYYVEPIEGNEQVLGFDLASHPDRKRALRQASESGQRIATTTIDLLQGDKGVLVFEPVYSSSKQSKTAEGYIVGVYRINDLVDRSVQDSAMSNIELHIYEMDESDSNLIFTSRKSVEAESIMNNLLNGLHEVFPVSVAGRQWSVVTTLKPGTFGKVSKQAYFIFISGLLLTFALVGAMRANYIKAEQVERAVESKTHELRNITQDLAANKKELQEALQDSERTNLAMQNVLDDLAVERDKFAISEQRISLATKASQIGIWDWDVITDILLWDDTMYALYGIPQDKAQVIYQTWKSALHPDDLDRVVGEIQIAMEGAGEFDTNFRIIQQGTKDIRHIKASATVIRNQDGEPIRMLGINLDVTEIREKEQAIHRAAEELRKSNKELEEFAYVASHDLQEPIRKIVGFTQLFAQKFEGKLDEESGKYMEYIVSGAIRMQTLIQDLLEYSRAGRKEIELADEDVTKIVEDALINLKMTIDEHGAQVSYDSLPTISAHHNFLVQVFQNLIGNGIKYCKADVPEIHISAEQNCESWIFSVADNGIGIDPQFKDRVFAIFQRLHGRAEYSGTGIGLAVCRVMIERHGGKIWVESNGQNQGSVFKFTLPI